MRNALIAVALLLAAPPAAAQYQVKIDLVNGDLLLQLAITADPQHPTKLAPRGVAWGLHAQVQDVKCGDTVLHQDGTGAWVAPPGCSRISWRVKPDEFSHGSVDASKQRTLAVGPARWLLLAEPTSLLRSLGVSGPSTLGAASNSDGLLGATPVAPGRYRVPSSNNAPEFYVVGRAAAESRDVGDLHVTYVADDPNRVERLGLQELHAKALSYLATVVQLPKTLPDSSRRLLVIWLATRAHAPLGGAAGSRSLVANYLIGTPAGQINNRAMTLAIMAHEQFHQLVDLVRDGGLAPLPVWLSESLAQYYGLKALAHAEHSDAAVAVSRQFIDPSASSPDGLLELSRRYDSGDRSVYSRFYSQGATLWSEVDLAIAKATSGRQSLDDYVNELVVSKVPDGGSLPAAFVQSLRRVAGPEADQIIERYVGR